MEDVSGQLQELLHVTKQDLVATGLALYPDLFFTRPCPLHYKLSWALVCTQESTCLAFPREFGKTVTVWEGHASWNVLHQRYRYTMYIATSLSKATKALRNIQSAILGHPLLKTLISSFHATKEEFTYKIGTKEFKIACFGVGQNLRGERYLSFRPDLIICDDLENTENVRNPDQRAKLKDWFYSDVMPLGKEARFFYVGTMLHEDSLLANLQETPPVDPKTGKEWQIFRYGVIDEATGKPTWPEKYDEAWINAKRKEYIRQNMLYRFNTEYMNIAVGRDDRSFEPTQVRFYSPDQWAATRKGRLDIVTIVDPGIKATGDHDPTVIWTSALDPIGQMWVLNIVRKHMMKTEMLNTIVEEYNKWNPRQTYIEGVQGQYYLIQDLEQGSWPGGVCMNVEELDGKQVQMGKNRIYNLQPFFEQRKILVPAGAEWWVDFQEEMVTFPRGKHDDMLDCGAYAAMNHIKIRKASIDVDKLLSKPCSTVF